MTLTTTPVVYDPYAYEIHEDPYPTYARMRSEAPVYRNDERNFWALSRYDDVMAGFRDSERFSNAHGVSIDPAASGPNAHRTMSFLAMDPPEHGRMRGLVSRGFTPRRVAAMEDDIRALTVSHLDACLQSGSFDFVGDLAAKVPMDVISQMLGVPQADRERLRRASDLLVHREEGVTDVPKAGVEAAIELAVYYSEMIADRRINPGDDLVSALCEVETDGDRLTDDEITSFLFLMVVAGNETTTKLLAHAWYWAWANPDERAKVFADPARIPDWVEETLRYDTSSQMLARRHAARHDDPRRRPGAAAGRIGQPGPPAVSRSRPLRPGPRHHRHRQLRRGTPLLHGRLAGPAGDPGGPRGADQADRVLRDRCRGRQAGALGERPRVRHPPHHF